MSYLNTTHPNSDTQRIARAELDKIIESIGEKRPVTDTDMLHGRPYEAKVGIEDMKDRGGNVMKTEAGEIKKKNVITEYRSVQQESGIKPTDNNKSQDQPW